MLRALLVFAFPFATMLADQPTLDRIPFQGAQGRIDLADIPIAKDPAGDGAAELGRLRASAERGDLEAQARLGVMYYWGEGAPMDWQEAKGWLRKAAERGSMDAQAKLGAMFFLGQGGARDLDESVKWFRMAAEQGEPYAQGCMGVMCAVGEGLPKDLVQAYVWLSQALFGGDSDAAEPLAQVKIRLTPAQLQEAERRVGRVVKTRSAN
ncbi:MAG: tetratricopeptide repeat protein [Holophaga sp.]|nr:tetratricopeptide repeat protein [Holophaga sp.]